MGDGSYKRRRYRDASKDWLRNVVAARAELVFQGEVHSQNTNEMMMTVR